ncbi:MAG: M48 family metallopeptidase [Burkholderiaceae bacterium]
MPLRFLTKLFGARPATLDYELVRTRRTTVGLIVNGRGLQVRAPQRASIAHIESVLHEKADWIVDKLAQRAAFEAQRIAPMEALRDGMQLPLFGRPLTLRLGPGHPARPVFDAAANTLCLRHQPDEPLDRLQKKLDDWFKMRARQAFDTRISALRGQVKVELAAWALSSARTRWGSCSGRRCIRLNWRLVHYPAAVIDYVVAHEMAHLEEMNHSARFWAMVDRLCPGYEAARRLLKQYEPATVPRFESGGKD